VLNSCNFRDFVFADFDLDLDLDPDFADLLFFELIGDLSDPPTNLLLLYYRFTHCEESADVINNTFYLDLAFSATFDL